MTTSSSREQKSVWSLENNSPDLAGKWSVEIRSTPFIIGRTDDNGLVLRSRAVSRHHAEINLSGELLWIRDLESTNGTFVNRRRIFEAVELKEYDAVNLGGAELIVRKESKEDTKDVLDETSALDMTKELEAYKATVDFKPTLQSLLANRAVIPHYQSIVDIKSSAVAAYELLGRIEKDYELPTDIEQLFEVCSFFNLAPDLSNLFRMEGLHVRDRLGGSFQLFMNTHPAEMLQIKEFGQSLAQLRKNAPDAMIVMEIHERSIQSIETLQYLRSILADLDMQLAYDDFGVGETRLVELAKVPPDYLKFDISIIRNIHAAPPRLHQMVKTFVAASRDLGINTLAEGIETREEHETCRELGFQYAQGFYFGKPIPIRERSL